MNTKNEISSQEVHRKTLELATEERRINAELLRYLHVVESRRLHLEMGFPSLYAYCTKYLKLSEGATSRRISAMRLIYNLPNQEETLKALEQGQVNLNTLSAVHHFIREEKEERQKQYTPCEKQELVQEIQGRSQRECEVLFATISPQAIPKEKERVLSDQHTELRVILTEELRLQLEKIRLLVSHQNPSPSYAELFSLMAKIVLKKLDPEQQAGKRLLKFSHSQAPSSDASKLIESAPPMSSPDQDAQCANAAAVGERIARWIPRPVYRQVWKRDHGACTFVDSVTGLRCGSRFQVQLDHRKAFAQGGEHTVENLRCVCRAHNICYAVQVFGVEKMAAYRKG